ncbi:MAG TPA: reverse transcriptase-like protein [bacterium]|nr:reverse transcriptase-like protein [bacterium]
MKPLDVFTSTAFRDGRAGCGIVLRASGQTVRVIRRAVPAGSRAEGAYRALLHGVWRARGTGARHIRVFSDTPEVVDQVTGRSEVPVELVGLYLQTRALLNAYRGSAVAAIPRGQNAEAAIAALEALDQPTGPAQDIDDVEDLPLFSPSLTDA